MKDLSSTSFGYLIAFLLPGLLGLYALSYWVPQVKDQLQPFLSATATVGPSLTLLLIAVGAGLVVSAVRNFVLVKFWSEFVLKKPALRADLYRVLNAEKLAVHKALAEEHYRYHQFYGGCFVALAVMFAGVLYGWFIQGTPRPSYLGITAYVVAFLLTEVVLERSAMDCNCKYVDKCNTLPDEKPQ